MPDRPNILVFFSDQQRWDTCGCYGQELPITPHLDRMAAEGVRFENAFTPQPVCGPARAVLQSGQYASQAGVYTNGIALATDSREHLAHQMRQAGYEVGYIGKWHLASTGIVHPGARPGQDVKCNLRTEAVPPEFRGGYDDYWLASDTLEYTSHSYDGHMFDGDGQRREFPEGRFRADAQTDWVIEYLQTRTGEKPFFLFVSYIEPHHQNDHECFEGPRGSKDRFRNYTVPGDLQRTEGDWRKEMPDYLGCCKSLDDNLGRIRAELDRLGLADNTLILYTSDHGCHFRTRNKEYKRSCHDNCVRIPMVACGPGFAGGKVVSELVSLIDIPSTIVAAGGAPVPDHFEGGQLQTLADGSATDWPDDVFIELSEDICGRAIRTHRWKYAVCAPDVIPHAPGSDVYVEDFLYDLAADPHERTNLVADPALADIRAELAARLKHHIAAVGQGEVTIKLAERG
jgi:arylsulfatase A-like enzyme